MTMNVEKAWAAFTQITAERMRQEHCKAIGRFKYTCADTEMSNEERLAVLVEEVGEVARCILEKNIANDKHNKDLSNELVQVAAVAVAWLEGLTSEREREGGIATETA